MHRLTIVIVVAGLGLLLTACGGASPKSSAPAGGTSSHGSARTTGTGSATPALSVQTVEVDEVTVKAEPRRVDATGASFQLTLDTHVTPLDMSLPSAARLTVGGRPWRSAAWDGGGPGGHHREGTVRFLPGGPVEGAIELSVGGLSRSATFRWDSSVR